MISPADLRTLEFSPDGHYIRTPVETLSPEVEAATKAAFEDEPDQIERLNRLRKLIVSVFSHLQQAQQWQPIFEIPAKDGDQILAYCLGGFQCVATFSEYWGTWQVPNASLRITHGQPLPLPPLPVEPK